MCQRLSFDPPENEKEWLNREIPVEVAVKSHFTLAFEALGFTSFSLTFQYLYSIPYVCLKLRVVAIHEVGDVVECFSFEISQNINAELSSQALPWTSAKKAV